MATALAPALSAVKVQIPRAADEAVPLAAGGIRKPPPTTRTAVDAGFGDEIPLWYMDHVVEGKAIPAGANARFKVGSREIVIENGKRVGE